MTARRVVYVTPQGECFHRDASCPALSAMWSDHTQHLAIRQAGRAEVLRRRLRPCGRCDPPRFELEVVGA